MVQTDPRKDPYEIIKKINAFLARHTLGIFVLIRVFVFIWQAILFIAQLSLLGFGIANLFFFKQPLLGFFQLLTLGYWSLYIHQAEKVNQLHIHAQAAENALANSLDVMQKLASPAHTASFFSKPEKKKTKVIN